MRVTVIGLGIIGSRVAKNLRQDESLDVRSWNRTPKQLGGECDDLLEAASGSDVVMLYLKDSPAVREVIAELDHKLSSGTRILNHSTVDLETTMWLSEICMKNGWQFLDAPFTGSRDAAATSQLMYYVGGSNELIEEVTPLLLKSGKDLLKCGQVGHATIIKLVTNLVSACTVQALSEAMATAAQHGIDPDAFTKAIASNACGSPLAAMKLPSMAKGDFTTHFSLENMLKDSRYVLKLAEQLETPAINAVSNRMAELCEDGLANDDYSALAQPYLK